MIALKKKTGGIRPIGIGEAMKIIVTKAISWQIEWQVKQATGSKHCNGLPGACEAAIKTVREEYDKGNTVLIIDADGAFSNLKRYQALYTEAERSNQHWTKKPLGRKQIKRNQRMVRPPAHQKPRKIPKQI